MSEWISALTPPESAEVVIGLACLRTKPGSEHPMMVQYTEEYGWEMVCYTGQTPLPINVIAWMHRPEFAFARNEFRRQIERATAEGADAA